MTVRTSWQIRRDDGEVMETGLTEEVARRRVRTVYDPSEYLAIEWNEYVPAVPLPLYEGPLARLRRRLLRR